MSWTHLFYDSKVLSFWVRRQWCPEPEHKDKFGRGEGLFSDWWSLIICRVANPSLTLLLSSLTLLSPSSLSLTLLMDERTVQLSKTWMRNSSILTSAEKKKVVSPSRHVTTSWRHLWRWRWRWEVRTAHPIRQGLHLCWTGRQAKGTARGASTPAHL